jgi:alpha-N-arabinofuranosidase
LIGSGALVERARFGGLGEAALPFGRLPPAPAPGPSLSKRLASRVEGGSMQLGRREFLAVTTGAVAATVLAPRTAAASDTRIEILPGEPIGRIAPEIHGHFVEHLGGVVYDGVWVGEGSKIPNDGGIRRALIDALKAIKAPVIRWPGGCFADSYDWRDGIGPRESRPTRTNFWVAVPGITGDAQKFEPNAFGSNDFMRLCRLVGAQPYFAANLRSLPAQEFANWVDYANAPAGSTTLAQKRGGEPFNVRFWGVGNESWGCGGNFTPQEYATEFRRYTAWVPSYKEGDLAFIAAGPSSGEIEWTRGFFEGLAKKGPGQIRSVWGFALHHYTWNVSQGKTNDWDAGKGDALKFTEEEWYELLRQGDQMESLITRHWDVMGEYDRTHHVKLAVDEWGAWHRWPGSQVAPTHLFGQQSTLRDALLTGLTLDTFNRHADKVAMANVAQVVNCLHSLFLADGDRFVVTPAYHVFAMHADHQGAEALRTVIAAPRVSHTRNGQPANFWGLAGSASRKDNRVLLTLVNPAIKEPREAEIVVRGTPIKSAQWTHLTSADLAAHNSFERPNGLEPTRGQGRVEGGRVVHQIPPASVVRLELMV